MTRKRHLISKTHYTADLPLGQTIHEFTISRKLILSHTASFLFEFIPTSLLSWWVSGLFLALGVLNDFEESRDVIFHLVSYYDVKCLTNIAIRALIRNPIFIMGWDVTVMMTSSNGHIFRVTDHLCGEFTGDRWIPRTKASDAELLFFSLICALINSWVNNDEAGDLRPTCPLWRHCNDTSNPLTSRAVQLNRHWSKGID